MLLIIDDAWDSSHVRHFLVGGHHCQVLVTTRDALIANAIGAILYDLEVMTPIQSLSLLSKRLRRQLEDSEQQKGLELADLVGYLPFAVELAAAQIADNISWDELLEDLRSEVGRLESLDYPGASETDDVTRRKLSLKASLQLSLQRLSEEKRAAFIWLGVLPDDAILTTGMATTLWNCNERKARETLSYFRDK
jgi:hypothetical protein